LGVPFLGTIQTGILFDQRRFKSVTSFSINLKVEKPGRQTPETSAGVLES
jgi:hypothetical protein